jgi:hypothetical protein
MNISVKVKPNSKEEKIEKISDSEFLLWVRSAPKEGKANQEIAKLLSEYFDVPRTDISIVRGHKSRNKIVSLNPIKK